MKVEAFIFDLDGVIISTDEYHYQAWKKLAEEEDIPYSREVNVFQRGVSRMESLEVMLGKADRTYTEAEKLAMAERKNAYYKQMIQSLRPSDCLPVCHRLPTGLRKHGIAIAIGSSSKNTLTILQSIGMDRTFDAIADGTQITNSKPDPEVFLLAATLLNKSPENCIVVEDADAGISAALSAGMGAFAVGTAQNNPHTHFAANTLADITCEQVLEHFSELTL